MSAGGADPARIVEHLRGTPGWRAAEQAVLEQDLAKRREDAGERTELLAARDRELPRLAAAEASATAEVERARRDLETAEAAAQEARHAASVASTDYDRRLRLVEGRLRASAPAAIAAFIASLPAAEDKARRAFWVTEKKPLAYRVFGGGEVRNNEQEVLQAVTTLRAIRREAEALQLEPLTESEAIARLLRLRQHLTRALAFRQRPAE